MQKATEMNRNNGTKLGGTQGIVKWFNTQKGFGFITLDDGREAFVHFSKVRGRQSLNEGEKVCAQLWKGEKGLYCTDVEVDESGA